MGGGLILVACLTAALLVASGFFIGIYFGARQSPPAAGIVSASDTVVALEKIAQRLDSLARHGADGLQSLRQTLERGASAADNDDLCRQIDELLRINQQLEEQLHMLHGANAATVMATEPSGRPATTATDDERSPNHAPKLAPAASTRAAGDRFAVFLEALTQRVDRGDNLPQLLDFVYAEAREIVPAQRMGFARISFDGKKVVSIWCRAELPLKLGVGYTAEMADSSLRFVALQNRPRILSDLPAYLQRHPNSLSTRLMVEEGYRSSMTCPVKMRGTTRGFLFLTSVGVDTYRDDHVERIGQVVDQISRSLEHAQDSKRDTAEG